MHETIRKIMDAVKSDDQIDATNIEMNVKVKIFKRRKFIIINGTINSEEAKQKVQRFAEVEARDDFDIVNELTVKS